MGELERKARKYINKSKVQEAILVSIASGGRRGSSDLLPSVLNYFLDLDIPISSRKKDIIYSAVSRLRRKGLVEFKSGKYFLTTDGEKVLRQWEMDDYRIPKPKRWDRKWRIIIFDIPEKMKKVRDEVREILKSSAFLRLQDSVWVYPYDCEDVIGLLKTNYGIGKNMLYIIADQIENDKYLRMDFDLI